MSYRNKTYVAFASEDINQYRLMKAWRANTHIDFSFFDAHDLNVALDSSQRETIKRRLRERLNNAKQVVLLGSPAGRKKGGDGRSFLAYEVAAILDLNLPVVVANLDGSRQSQPSRIPQPLSDRVHFTVSVSFQPAIIKYALDNYVPTFRAGKNSGPHQYRSAVYSSLGL